jgi:hypothetical protein
LPSVNNNRASGSGIVQIDVNRWSTAAERAALLNVLKEGAEKLLDALQDTRPVGIITTPDSLGNDLQGQRHVVVRHEDIPAGDMIVLENFGTQPVMLTAVKRESHS